MDAVSNVGTWVTEGAAHSCLEIEVAANGYQKRKVGLDEGERKGRCIGFCLSSRKGTLVATLPRSSVYPAEYSCFEVLKLNSQNQA